MLVKKIHFIVLAALSSFLIINPTTSYASSCSIHFTVNNESGHLIGGIDVQGPWFRASSEHNLKNGEHFKYHADGSAFNCHGKYWVTNVGWHPSLTESAGANITYTVDSDKHNIKHNISETITILPDCSKSGRCSTDWQSHI